MEFRVGIPLYCYILSNICYQNFCAAITGFMNTLIDFSLWESVKATCSRLNRGRCYTS